MTTQTRETADAQFLNMWPADTLPEPDRFDAIIAAWDAWSTTSGCTPHGDGNSRWRSALALKALLSCRLNDDDIDFPAQPGTPAGRADGRRRATVPAPRSGAVAAKT